MKKIAFIAPPNYDELLSKASDFVNEFHVLAPLLKNRGFQLELKTWNHPDVDWTSYEFIIPKAAWDYFEHPKEFRNWLNRLDSQGVAFRNSATLIKWNMDKRYLLDLAANGKCVPHFAYIEPPAPNEQINWAQATQAIESEELVIKPAVSGGARHTIRTSKKKIHECADLFNTIHRDCAVIAQPFFPEICDAGEWSFFFFGMKFTHAILRKPKSDDFRAHSYFGGTVTPQNPTLEQIEQARAFIQDLPVAPHYARVDGFFRNGKLHLIELELIEPYLYFETAPKNIAMLFTEALLATDT